MQSSSSSRLATRPTTSALALLLLLLILTPLPTASQTTTLRFTARYFLPAQCALSIGELNRVWNYSLMAAPSYSPATYPVVGYKGGSITSDCPIWTDIAEGKYAGHPDFEVYQTNNPYSEGCSGNNYDLTNSTFCTGCYGCTAGSLSRVVEPTMEYAEDGLAKPPYCKRDSTAPLNGRYNTPSSIPQADNRCGWNVLPGTSTPRATTSGTEYFRSWFIDDPKLNRRVGFQVTLTPTPTPGVVSYVSSSESTGRFHPCSQNTQGKCKPCLATTGGRLNCTNNGKIWPVHKKLSFDEAVDQSVFSFTTEHHSFFTFRGNETLQFTGDDDVWIYINERLAADLGGLHSESSMRIDLSKPYVRSRLNIVPGQVYALDTYQAERHTVGSNFKLSTSLSPECNVLQSGKPAYAWRESTFAADWKLVGGPGFGQLRNSALVLTNSSVINVASYAYLKQQVNVGAGFVAQFTFQASANRGEGFVFGMRRDDIINMNGGTGGNLGFKNTPDSFGIAFDFCPDRDVNVTNPLCQQSELRLHYLDNGGLNNASTGTKKLRSKLYAPVILNDGLNHTVLVRYFAQRPPWLEVFIDDDLFLQKRGINLDEVLRGRNAFVGFTAATGLAASTIRINDFSINTVGIEDVQTIAVNWNATSTAVANGRQRVKFRLQNYDLCNGRIEFGGFPARAFGTLTRIPDVTTTRRLLVNATLPGNATASINATVVDLGTGEYSLEFATTWVGNYSLKTWFGVSCFNAQGQLLANPPSSTCFQAQSNNAATFTPPVLLTDPSNEVLTGLSGMSLIAVGAAMAGVFVCGMIMIFFGVRVRNEWRRDKQFIEAGRIAAAERGVNYLGDNELDKLQNKLQSTLHEIQYEKSRGNAIPEDKQKIIDELLRQQGELQEQVRRIKVRLQGGDAEDVAPAPYLQRARKSFARARPFSMSVGDTARRVTRAVSRSNTKSEMVVVHAEEEPASGNPLFTDLSSKLKR